MERKALAIVILMLVPAFSAASPADSPLDDNRPSAHPGAQMPAPALSEVNYSDVMLLINNQSAISIQIGNYFKQKRNIPDRNICNISMPASEWISQAQFQTVRAKVEGWINNSGLNDSLNYIVTTKGCPLTVGGSNYTYASFMDELSLILGPYAGQIGNNYWMNNPYFDSQQRFSRKAFSIFLVTRLDGYDLNDCKRLVDNALNSTGRRGTFVLDSQPWKDGGGYQSGNDWCRQANRTLVKRGYDVYFDDTPYYVIDQNNVSGYCSWGSNDGNCPNSTAKTMFTWVPGAIGSTYVSTSARSFGYPPSYTQSLIADNIREGITGIHGNVAEPFLTACARPNIFLDRYTRGWNLADSMAASMATESWENCIIGDPKIEPYANQPDPAIYAADMNLSADTIIEGMDVLLTANVRNVGGGPAENTTVSFYDGAPGYGGARIGVNLTIPLLPAGGEFPVQYIWATTGLSGVHDLYIVLSVSNSTQQLWEGNDQAFISATVYQRPALVLAPARFTVSDLSPQEGDTVSFDFNVRNAGGYPAATTLDLFIDGARLQSKNISLWGGSEQNERFTWSTLGHPGAHSALISAAPVPYELNASDNNLSAQLFVRQYGLSMRSDALSKRCLPGLAASFNITVNGSANFPESVNLSLSALPQFWMASLEPSSAVLLPGSSSTHRLLVFSPIFASVQDRCGLIVTCEGGTSRLRLELALNVTIAPVRGLRLSCDQAGGTALPGENATFKLDIQNTGNGPDSVNLTWKAPPGWQVEMEAAHVEIPYQGFSSLILKVSPSGSTTAGKSGTVTVAAVSADGKSFETSVEVEAEQYFGLEASLSPDNLTLRPDEESEVLLSIMNLGNGPDAFSLLLPRTDLSLSAPSVMVSLDAFSSQNVSITVKVPRSFKMNRERLQFGVESQAAGRVSVPLDVRVLRPDLSVLRTDISLAPAAPVEGEQVTVTARVRNAGTGDSGPVTVGLSDGGRALASLSIADLAPGESASVSFLWNATPGGHDLGISAECGYPDPTPGDAAASVTVNVPAKPVVHRQHEDRMAVSTAALAAVAILVMLAAAALAAFVLLRRRRGGGK